VQAYEEEKGIHGFDVIVCRPQGAFGYNSVRNYIHTGEVQTSHDRGLGEIYRTLLTRGLNLMSAEDGLFFLQLPKTGIDEPTLTAFWKEYQQEKEKEGYDFYFNESRPEQSSQVLIRRRPVQKDAAERMG
ncbi:MAG TPA: hypothetical protein VHB93_00360, partial [Candidatus Paceibacterota bacterium]|nr:hypothetical protein [Candidatus Paceibacterota bacterium]